MRLQGLALSDLEILKPLGKGTFGSVYIAKHIISGFLKGYVALKCLDKKALVENSQQAYIKREIAALHACHHPFIVEYFSKTYSCIFIYLFILYSFFFCLLIKNN